MLGGRLDYVFDRIRVLTCTLALMWGQYRETHQEVYLILGVAVVFLDMLRYVDALQVAKVRRQMRGELTKAIEESASAHAPDFARALAEIRGTEPEPAQVG